MYQAQNAIMKPNHEKKKTRPYILTTLNTGNARAFLLTGLISGALTRSASVNPRPMLQVAV